jgi:two-component system response regulator PilR (NtrC family)
VILAETLPLHVGPSPATAAGCDARGTGVRTGLPSLPELPDLADGFDLEARGDDFYRHYISLALDRAGGVQTRAAELLGMSFRSFRYYAKKFNIR